MLIMCNRQGQCSPYTTNCDNKMQINNITPIDNKSTAVVCIMIADDDSFTSTPLLTNGDQSIPPTIQDLSGTLNNVIIIDHDNTVDHSIKSSTGEHEIHTIVLNHS